MTKPTECPRFPHNIAGPCPFCGYDVMTSLVWENGNHRYLPPEEWAKFKRIEASDEA